MPLMARATTYKDSLVVTQTLQPLELQGLEALLRPFRTSGLKPGPPKSQTPLLSERFSK
jgi:hypothetical protein